LDKTVQHPLYLIDLLIKKRGRNNFRNYASQLQATLARSQIPKVEGIAGYFDAFVI
jgi:hypothetical protein